MERALFFVITPQTFRELFDRYYEPLCRSLEYYTRDTQAIEEIVEDIFVTLWENREHQQIEYIKAYLFSAARNRALNYLRDKQRQTSLLELWAQDSLQQMQGQDILDYDKLVPQLQKAVDLLPEKCREIFELKQKNRLTYNQIAELLHISVKTVESQMSIAHRKIRDYFLSNYDLS
jgi:RNA polymerase sigma factor, sigma-70 family/RNA polymerase sigma-70 factor, Bacteroides expansion family 1